ncbi:MAG: hypothetical protein WCV00_06715 [Verrucomicrobiia bacterium]
MSDLMTQHVDDASKTHSLRSGLLCVPNGLLTVMFVLLLAPWLAVSVLLLQTKPVRKLVATMTNASNRTDPDRVYQLAKGPWGDVTCIRIALGPPQEFLFANQPKTSIPRWFFKGFSTDRLRQFLNGVELTMEERVALLNVNEWKVSPEGIWLQPPVQVVLQLGPNARRQIYGVLCNYWENETQHAPLVFSPGFVDERFADSGVSPATVEKVKRLLYPQDKWLLLADIFVLMSQMADSAERRELYQTVMQQWTYTAKLRVKPDSNIDQLADYWGAGRRNKDLRPLLESLRRVQGGAELDIAHLLPTFARERLYTFPYPTENPLELRRDCHWTSLNFFNEVPDDSFTDLKNVAHVMAADHDPVIGNPKMGDIVLLMSPTGSVVHSCVYIVDGIVFNKRGSHFLEPWVLVKLQDAVDFYRVVYRPDYALAIKFFRKRQTAAE